MTEEDKILFLAGMAMPQCIETVRYALEHGALLTEESMTKQVAVMAVQYANSLMEEINKNSRSNEQSYI